MNAKPKLFTPGIIEAEGNRCLTISPDGLLCHVSINGGTGRGKTRALEAILAQAAHMGKGFTYVTPSSEAVSSLLDRLQAMGVDPSRVVLLRPGTDRLFSIDPFTRRQLGETFLAYESRLRSTCTRVFSSFIRRMSADEQEMVKRLRRWFESAAYLCGLDMNGEHLGLSALPSFFDPTTPEFVTNMARVRPFIRSKLGRQYLRNFEKLAATLQARQQEQWTESSHNLAHTVFSPIIYRMFDPRDNALDYRQFILQHKIVIIDVSETDHCSREEGNVIAGILIKKLIDAARCIPKEDRVLHILACDECENFIGEDIRKGYSELRQYKVSLICAFQDLTCLMKGDLDLVNRVISQCGIQMTFQQQSPDDIEYLARYFAYGNLDLTPLLVNEVLPDGYEWVPTESVAYSNTNGKTVSKSETLAQAWAKARATHTSQSINEAFSLALSQSHMEGSSLTLADGVSSVYTISNGWKLDVGKGHSETKSKGSGTTENTTETTTNGTASSDSRPVDIGGRMSPGAPTHGESQSAARAHALANGLTHTKTSGSADTITVTGGVSGGEAEAEGETHSVARGVNSADTNCVALTSGNSKARMKGESESEVKTLTAGKADGVAESQQAGVTRTYAWTPLAKVKITQVPSGRLVISVEDQLAAIMNILASLPRQMLLCKAQGMKSPFILRVHDVTDPYGDSITREERERRRAAYLERVFDKPFYFVPRDEEDDRCRCGEDECACEPVAVPTGKTQKARF